MRGQKREEAVAGLEHSEREDCGTEEPGCRSLGGRQLPLGLEYSI